MLQGSLLPSASADGFKTEGKAFSSVGFIPFHYKYLIKGSKLKINKGYILQLCKKEQSCYNAVINHIAPPARKYIYLQCMFLITLEPLTNE